MKRTMSFLICLLLVLTVLHPLGSLIAAIFGYRFVLISIPAFAVAISGVSIVVFILDFLFNNTLENSAMQVPLAIIVPFSLLNVLFYAVPYPNFWLVIGIYCSIGCCCYLAVKYGKPVVLKIIALILSALMVLPIAFVSFIDLIFGNFGQLTVVQTIDSPSGKYCAQVIDSDQGALGGDTLVNVSKKSNLNLILFKIEKKPETIYVGAWGEFDDIQIYWKDDTCLIINCVEYPIKQ